MFPRVVCLTAILLAAAAPAAAADVSSLSITAGAGGLVKAGRWVPVQVSLALGNDAVEPELVVSWGTATVRRLVAAGGEAGRRIEIYIRTSEVAGAITAQLRSGGRVLAQAEAPVRSLPQAEPLVVCVDEARDAECTANVPADQLPTSTRGYEAIDRLIFTSDAPPLAADQSEALVAWRALQRLNEGGDLGLVAQPARPTLPRGLPAPLLRSVTAIALAYVGALLVVGLARPLPWRAARRGPLVFAAIVGAGSATVLAFGAGLPERPVVVHHSSLIEQLPGSETSIISVRAIAEFPAVGHFELRWPLADAMLEPASSVAGTEHTFEAGGHPIIAGRRGLGARQAFIGEATAPVQILVVHANGSMVTVSNDSAFDLTGCQFGTGYERTSEPALAGALPAGASVTATQTGQPAGPLLSCAFGGIVVPFEEPASAVLSTGSTTIAVYR